MKLILLDLIADNLFPDQAFLSAYSHSTAAIQKSSDKTKYQNMFVSLAHFTCSLLMILTIVRES